MSLDTEDEIVQDFIVEAGEILELLSEQLVELETKTDDNDLLNAIFRGFHTVKGGAGFLSLNALVDVCHSTENLFDLLKRGERSVNPDLMDVVLRALDAVNAMFVEIRQGQMPSPAEPGLIVELDAIVKGEPISQSEVATETTTAASTEDKEKTTQSTTEVTTEEAEEKTDKATDTADDEISEEEFENFLDNISTSCTKDTDNASDQRATSIEEQSNNLEKKQEILQHASKGSEDITENEFENLLDALLEVEDESPDSGAASSAEKDKISNAESESAKQQSSSEPVPVDTSARDKILDKAAVGGDDITEDEFENLLDELGGSSDTLTDSPKDEVKSATIVKENSEVKSEVKSEDKSKTTAEVVDESKSADKSPSRVSEMLKEKAKNRSESEVKSSPAPASASASASASSQDSAPASASSEASKAASTTSKAPGAIKDSSAAETTVRVDTSRLDEIMNMVGELVLVRNRLVKLKSDNQDEELTKVVSNLDVVTANLQMAVMKTRMQPIKKVFGRFPRVVRDLARSLNKEVALEMEGEETDLDKNLVEALSDPLVHLVRNSVDHGIEDPNARLQLGKPKQGKIILAAEQAGDHILLSITDDGKGMDAEDLRKRVVEKGFMDADAAARLDAKECYNLIFMPGFSTRAEVSDISGRGVGMDVVKTKISQLNGSIEIDSKKGEGSKIIIKVPLTLAILPTLMVVIGEQVFALPLTCVNEIFNLDLGRTNTVDGQMVITVREKTVPLFYLNKWLETVNTSFATSGIKANSKNGHVVIVTIGTMKVGFVVDGLLGQEEVVIKALGDMLHGTPGMAGATITGDGKIAMILDVPGLLSRYA